MRKILLVGENAELEERLRKSADCHIETVRAESAALWRLRCAAFDIVLTAPVTTLDHDLELLDELRRIQPGLKIIILAASATPEDVIEAMQAQVFACFTAPVNLTDVVEMVESALEGDDWQGGIQILSATANWISLRVASRRVTAERLTRFMKELRTDISVPEREDLITAFREILLNAMEHGAGFDPEKVVEISAVRTERAIVYYFRDPGPGFAIGGKPHVMEDGDPTSHIEYRASQGIRPGGFGIFMAKQLVDELIYSQAGNEVLLIKHTN
jgi:anti-sigma regulatory factor (Ser/Thr protein kinase)/CheY-like chemotaxis protein